MVEVEPAGSMGETELESGVELSVEEDDSLPAVKPGQSFSSIRESRAQFSILVSYQRRACVQTH